MLLKKSKNTASTVLTVSTISMLLAHTMFTVVSGPVILGGVGIKKAAKATSKIALCNVIGTVPIISSIGAVVSKE